MYGPFINEELVGEAIRGRRDQVVLATKFGNVRAPTATFLGINGDPSTCAAPATRRCKRLGVDHIDLYYQHRVDPKTSDRGHRRRDGGARDRRARSVTSACPRRRPPRSDARTRCIRSPRCRRSTRCGRATLEDEHPADAARAGHRLRAVQPARPRVADRRDQARRTCRRPIRAAPRSRVSRARTLEAEPRTGRRGSRRSPTGRAARRASSRWRGCWRRATTSCRSPARSG